MNRIIYRSLLESDKQTKAKKKVLKQEVFGQTEANGWSDLPTNLEFGRL
jgi:hypothetical protein